MAALDGLAIAGRETRHQPAARPPRPGRGAMDWDDVRVFLAVAREGSMRAAGRALGLSQPTIARRLAAFEATFGGPTLFDRLPEGLRLTAVGEQLVPAAESVEDAVLTLERRRAAASPVLSGTVRVSTGECAAGFLARCLSGPTTTALPSGITLYGSPEISGHECGLLFSGHGSIGGSPMERTKPEPRRPRRASGSRRDRRQTGSRPSRRHPCRPPDYEIPSWRASGCADSAKSAPPD